jgi:type IV secretion system protein VirB1
MDMPVTIHHIERCAPCAPTAIVEAIIRTESGFNPLAMNVNQRVKIARQPASRKEAEAWAMWLQVNGYNFDCGLMQINSANWEKLGLTPENVFDVCENIRAGAKLFSENHSRAAAILGPGRASFVSALSAYNTGDFTSGVHNGYVSRVVQNIHIGEKNILDIPPLIHGDKNRRDSTSSRSKKDSGSHGNSVEPDPFTSPSSIDDFTIEDPKPWDVEPKPESMHGSEERGASESSEQEFHGWRKELSMKSKRLFIAVLSAAAFLTGCVGAPVHASVVNLGYNVTNSGRTGLVRAFDAQNTTVLQFVDLEQ